MNRDHCVRPGSEFEFKTKPGNAARATFITIRDGKFFVTRYATSLFDLNDDVIVIANWHGTYRTDAFETTVGELKEKAKNFIYIPY